MLDLHNRIRHSLDGLDRLPLDVGPFLNERVEAFTEVV